MFMDAPHFCRHWWRTCGKIAALGLSFRALSVRGDWLRLAKVGMGRGFRSRDGIGMGQKRERREPFTLVRSTQGARRARGVLAGAGLALMGLSLAGCGAVDKIATIDPKWGVSASPRVVAAGEKVPKGTGYYKLGKPYTIAGKTYVPAEDPKYSEEGMASWYGRDFHGRLTANGEIFDMNSLSAAHKTLPLPSYVRVTNLANDRSVIVRVNNRGPFVGNRLVDLSYHTAEVLGFANKGLAKVRVDYVGPAPVEGSDDVKLAATLSTDGTPAQLPGASPVMVASAKPLVPDLPAAMPKTKGTPLPMKRSTDVADVSKPSAKPGSIQVASANAASSGNVTAAGWLEGAAPAAGLGFAGVPGSDGR